MKFANIIFALLLTVLIFNSCEKEVSVSPPDELPPQGTIVFNTNPSGFKIFLNGKDRARRTPDSLRFLEKGIYEITLKKDLFFDSTFTVEIGEDEKKNLIIDYSQNPKMLGEFFVESDPAGAEIFINGENTSQVTPYTFKNLLPDNYNIVLKSDNHRDVNYLAAVKSSEHVTKKLVLVDTTVWQDYNLLELGLTADNLTSITIDNDDNVWIGSRDGLVLYDGSWTQFNPSNSNLPHLVVYDVSLTQNNFIWIATQGGMALAAHKDIVMRYISAGQKLPLQPTGFPTDVVNKVFVNSNFPYLFATDKGLGFCSSYQGSYLYEWDEQQLLLQINTPLTSVWRYSKTGEIFAGTVGKGLLRTNEINLRLTGGHEYLTRGNYAMPTNTIIDMYEENNGGLWIAFQSDNLIPVSALSYYDGNQFTPTLLSTIDSKVRTIFVDSNNRKWVGTESTLFYFTDKINERKYLDEKYSGLKIEKVTGIAEDSNGNIWIATFENGLFRIKDVSKL